MDPLPADAFYDLTTPTELAVSPDGERVAFVAAESDPDEDERRRSVFVVPADGSRDPYRLTRVSDASSVAWSPDCSRLGVVMAREPDTELRVGRDDDGGDREGEKGDGADEDGDDGADGEAESDGDDESGNGAGEDEPRPQVWVYDLERGGDARQITDREEGVREFDWGPAGERIVVSARDPTEEHREYLERRREGGPIETERLQHKFDGTGWLDEVPTYLFVVDLETREERRLDGARGGGIPEAMAGLLPAWHPAEDRIAFCSYRGEDPDDTYVQDLHVIDLDGNRERVTDGEYTVGAPTWSPDGSRLAFTARDPENWYVPTDVRVAAGGDHAALTAELDRTLSWHGRPAWLDDRRLLAVVGDEGWSRFVRLDAGAAGVGADGGGPGDGAPGGGSTGTDDSPAHERVFERQPRDETLGQFDAAGGTVAAVRSRPDAGTDVYAMGAGDLDAGGAEADGQDADRGSDPRRRLTALNGDLLDEMDLPGTTRVTADGDGVEVEAIVYHPPEFDPSGAAADADGDSQAGTDADGGADPRPTVLWIHGGPMSYDEPRFDFDAAYWTSRGYLVCQVNYRGSTSYGRAFSESLKGAWNTVEVDDLLAGTDALVERGWADPDRLFVGGFSQGGVNTAYVLTRTDRFAAGMAEHGVYDMRSAFGTDDSHKWWENDFGLPWQDPEAYDDASSITDAGAIETPLLLTAGGEDWRCPPTQAEQLYVSLKKRGVASKLVVYPDEHHDIGDPDRAIHRLETLDGWVARFDPGREDEGD